MSSHHISHLPNITIMSRYREYGRGIEPVSCITFKNELVGDKYKETEKVILLIRGCKGMHCSSTVL
jgi:hypothetical protein